jgi:hypothetical protein
MEETRVANETYHNKKSSARSFEVGERILVYFLNTPRDVNPKFFKKWKDFTIVEKVGEVNLLVRGSARSNRIIIHIDRVRKFTEECLTTQEEKEA